MSFSVDRALTRRSERRDAGRVEEAGRMRIVAVIVAAGLLAGCAAGPGPGEYGGNKTTGGTLLGAAAGGLAGAQFGSGSGKLAATAAGVLLGAFLGNEVGRSLDRADRAYAQQAYSRAQAAPVGETITWSNPESGNRGQVTPTRDGRSASGEYCREFQQSIVVGGRTQQGYGVACQQPDGSWRVVQ
jgi:surface antigen